MGGATTQYADDLTVADARDLYFRDNGLSLDGYTARWVVLKVGPLPLAFPNTASRTAAVKLHDLHHLATGYATTWTGEAEIGAWEIAAGCGRYWAAWLLNVGAFGIGFWLAPRRVFRAFVRGRRSRSLYHRAFSEDLLAQRVRQLRTQLGLPAADVDTQPATPGERAAYVAWLSAYFGLLVASLAPLAALAWWIW